MVRFIVILFAAAVVGVPFPVSAGNKAVKSHADNLPASCERSAAIAVSRENMAEICRGQDVVRANLKDPDSAKFSAMYTTIAGAVCGTVRAKNSFGGYGDPMWLAVKGDDGLFIVNHGYRPFSSSSVPAQDPDRTVFIKTLVDACKATPTARATSESTTR